MRNRLKRILFETYGHAYRRGLVNFRGNGFYVAHNAACACCAEGIGCDTLGGIRQAPAKCRPRFAAVRAVFKSGRSKVCSTVGNIQFYIVFCPCAVGIAVGIDSDRRCRRVNGCNGDRRTANADTRVIRNGKDIAAVCCDRVTALIAVCYVLVALRPADRHALDA